MKRWEFLTLFIGILVGLQGCSVPPLPPNPIELPQHGLDFGVVLEKEVYQIGEPVVFRTKVKNLWSKSRILKILPDEEFRFSFEYDLFGPSIAGHFSIARHSSDKTIILTIPPRKEVEIHEMMWVWDQTDIRLKELVVIGRYYFYLKLAKVEVDSQLIGPVEIEVDESGRLLSFEIIHLVFERLRKMGIDFKLIETTDTEKSINIVGLINRSKQYLTLVIKPVGDNPVMRIRVLGPISKGYSPSLRAVREFKGTFSITLSPEPIWVLVKELVLVWDFRDQMTGEIVPDGDYVAFIELCGLIEVNGKAVGMIENPIKIYWVAFQRRDR